MQKFVKIQINITDKSHCSENCEYNDSSEWCQLFGEELNEGERCNNCVSSEQETEEE